MCCEGNESYQAEHLCQVNIDSLAPVHHLSALDDGVKNVGIKIQAQWQKHDGLHQQERPHDFVVNEGEASEVDRIQVIHMDAQEPQGQLLQPHRKEGEEELQGQKNPAVYQVPAATYHREVNREANEGDVVKGSRACQVFGAHHDFTQVRAQQPAATLPPVNGHGPQAQVDEVAASAPEDEHGHIAPYLALPAEQTGHQGDQDEDIQAKARDQKDDFRGGTEVQVDRDGAQGGRCLIHVRQVIKMTACGKDGEED